MTCGEAYLNMGVEVVFMVWEGHEGQRGNLERGRDLEKTTKISDRAVATATHCVKFSMSSPRTTEKHRRSKAAF